MKQLVQNFKSGGLKLIEVPAPQVKLGGLLVQNVNSVVSIGTEKLMMDFAKKSLLGKALARPDLTRQVIDFAKNEGLLKAYQQATSRLDNLTPLGYSSSGVVLDVGEGINDFKKGDRVACARGGFASHAEVILVPENLCVKAPDNVAFESAAFATVGAIALHSIRLCEASLGDRVAIIGLGLLGQLAVQIAKAAGYQVFGVDSDPGKVSLANQLGLDDSAIAGKDDVICKSESITKGHGFDAVIILASASSNEPLEVAAEICRHKGKIVVPGMVKLDVPRQTFYQKELSLVVSKGWGAGFDDPIYELKGIDYPHAYVRWTERKNMEQFLDLVSEGKVQIEPLITHKFKIDEAESAYKTMTEDKSGQFIGVLFSYNALEKESLAPRIQLMKIAKTEKPKRKTNVGLIGAGAFATGTMLPLIKKLSSVNSRGIATATGLTGKHAGDKFGFEYCTTDYKELLNDPEIDCILIATRHDLHAGFVTESLKHGKDVFVEKPLALTHDELKKIIAVYEESPHRLMVGFNRRFSPFTQKAKELISGIGEPLVINCRVNAGPVPKESWVHDSSQGGGRILGEVCHFVDLTQFLTGSLPIKVFAESLREAGIYNPDENVVITITFANGSLASVTYIANGDKSFPRERVEIFGGGSVCVIENYKSLVFTHKSKKKKMRAFSKDSGHKSEFATFFSAIEQGQLMPVDFKEYISTTLATFCIEESLSKGVPVNVDVMNYSK
ncbi:MAG: Gfo/Idh/MocA family oxidoreductase [Chloroflexi bacterium]|jgi:predicted dehydrogenase/threonine dehydrogenase-like Zn-dependent dehydrogenase|nr:Gfo/Idh/MocA family oxidoreductase [Chloroflexota bacterium]